MEFPFNLRFKLFALAPQIFVTDASGAPYFYVRQKLLKLKEDIGVCSDSNKTELLFRIQADRMIDWSANYRFTTAGIMITLLERRRG